MFNKVKNFFGLKTRSTPSVLSESGWRPVGSYGNNALNSLGVVGLAIRLYSDALIRFPLKVKNKNKENIDHYLLRLLEKPSSFQGKADFFVRLTSSVFLQGNFHAKIEHDQSGRITDLLSFVGNDCFAYPKYLQGGKGSTYGVGNSFSDPIGIKRHGFYYRDSRARIFMPYEILHVKDMVMNRFDLLNGVSRIRLARLAFDSGLDVQESIRGISQNGFIPPTLLSGNLSGDKEEKRAMKDKLEEFFKYGQTKNRRMLFLPEGVEAKALALDMKSADLEFIKKSTDLDMSKLFNLQVINNADSSPQASAKESYRALTFIALKPFLQNIADQFTNQLLTEKEKDQGVHFKYETQVLSSQDFREQSTYLKGLKESGIISANEARSFLDLKKSDQEGTDDLKAEKVTVEEIKVEATEDTDGEDLSMPPL